VRLTGNYGGEILRRVVAFKAVAPSPGLFSSEVTAHIRTAQATYRRLLRGDPLTFAVFQQGPWHFYGPLAVEQTQLSLRSPYLDNEFVRTVFQAPSAAFDSNDICLRLIADGNPALRSLRTDRGLAGEGNAAASLARRASLEFLFRAEYAWDYGMPDWLAKMDRALAPLHIERFFLGRHKLFHFRTWYRGPLSSYVRDILLDPRTLSRPYVDRRQLEMAVKRHVSGYANYTLEIHKLLAVELVHRLFIDSASQTSGA
jgi:asparagine synthase (glutamine-hydrolysing)